MREDKMDILYLADHIDDVRLVCEHEGSLDKFRESPYKSLKAYRNKRERDKWSDINEYIDMISEKRSTVQ